MVTAKHVDILKIMDTIMLMKCLFVKMSWVGLMYVIDSEMQT